VFELRVQDLDIIISRLLKLFKWLSRWLCPFPFPFLLLGLLCVWRFIFSFLISGRFVRGFCCRRLLSLNSYWALYHRRRWLWCKSSRWWCILNHGRKIELWFGRGFVLWHDL